MEQKHRLWIDLLIILGMVVLVYLLAQPLSRKWDEQTEEMYTGEEGVYALDMDTYYYIRKAREFTEGGLSSIRLFSGRSNDQMMTAVRSNADSRDPQLMSAMAALVWFLLRAIGIRISIYTLCIHFSSFILGLCTIPAYLFLKKRVSRDAAVVGALFVALAPPFFKHSFAGFFDTDAFICLLAGAMIFSLYECVLSKTRKEKIAYGAISVAATILLRFIWGSFYSYVVIAIGTAAFAVVVTRVLLKQKRPILIPLLAVCGMMIPMLGKMTSMINRFKSMFGTSNVQEPWPEASANLVEMTKTKLASSKGFWYWFMSVDSDLVSYCGGLVVIGFVILSCVLCTIRFIKRRSKKEEGNPERDFLFVAAGCWLLGSVYLSLRAVRFMEFVVLPMAVVIAFGFFIVRNWLVQEQRTKIQRRAGYLICAGVIFMVVVYWNGTAACVSAALIMAYGFFGSRMKKDYVLLAVLAAAILVSSFENTQLNVSGATPVVEKPLEDALIRIRDNADEKAVIADFWSYGYAYQYYAKCRSIADGGTYNGEYFYWLATMLLTDDEKLSAGIAGMLQGNGLDATDYAYGLCGGNRKACELLKEILPLSREQAEAVLKARYSQEQTEKLLSLTHPKDCPEIYLVMNTNMFRTAAGLLYFSEWDFTGMMTPENAAGLSTFLGQQSVIKPSEGESATCALWNKNSSGEWKAVLSVEDGEILGRLINPGGVSAVAKRTVYMKDGVLVYDELADPASTEEKVVDRGALLILEENNRISVVFCDVKMPDSVLFRLYLFGGAGQDTFEKMCEDLIPSDVSGESTVTQRRIGSQSVRKYNNYGVSVWRVRTGD